MQHRIRKFSTMIAAAASLSVAACGHGNNDYQQSAGGTVATPPTTVAPSDTASATTPGYGAVNSQSALAPADTTRVVTKHHSKLGGALVGAAAGHALGHHAVAGAALGALVQHERNKHEKQP